MVGICERVPGICISWKNGCGETTFIHALCECKHVSTPVGSPTFSLVNEYVYTGAEGERTIFHIDLYRLKDEEEAVQAGIEDCIYSGALCFVEWPERAPGIFPEDTIHVFMESKEDGLHHIKLRFPGENQ